MELRRWEEQTEMSPQARGVFQPFDSFRWRAEHREEAYRRAAGANGADAFLPKKALIALLLSVKVEGPKP